MKGSVLRKLIALLFFIATCAGFIAHTGWGSVCSFGIDTLSAICPLGAIESFVASGSMTLRTVAALVLFLLSIVVLGRFFCGWVCPVAVTHADQMPEKKRIPIHAVACGTKSSCSREKTHEGRYAAGILAGALASSAVFGFPVFCLICPVGLTFGLVIAVWNLFHFGDASWSILIFAGMLVLELVVLRRWCHRFCPIGAMMTLAARCNLFLRPTVTHAACLRSQGLDCRVCHEVCPEGIDLTHNPTRAELARCTKCRRCAEKCPQHAITFPFLPHQSEVTPSGTARKTPAVFSLQQEAARCIQCGKCVEHCPEHKPMDQVLALVRDGKKRAAAKLLLQSGSMPEVCSRVCPQEKLCQGACPLTMHGGAIRIGAIEQELVDAVLSRGALPVFRPQSKKSVAIVGAGPAGLACADVLARCGFKVTVFDQNPEVGGLLTYGIPVDKLDHAVIVNRQKRLQEDKVRFELQVRVGQTVTYTTLMERYDALFVATGASGIRPLSVPVGSGVAVTDALSFLKAQALARLNKVQPALSVKGKRLVVLGGGDTAMDVIGVAISLKAQSVTCLCRRAQSEVRASRSEMARLSAQGAQFHYLSQLTAIEDDRLTVQTQTGSQELKADVVVYAFGQINEIDRELLQLGVTYDTDCRIECRGKLAGQTANPRIFCGGDVRHGPSVVAEATADGKQAAHSIVSFLRSEKRK